MSSSSDSEEVLQLAQRKKDGKKDTPSVKHVATKSSDKSSGDARGSESKKDRKGDSSKDKKEKSKEKSKKATKEVEKSDSEDAMDVDDAPVSAKQQDDEEFVDDFDAEEKLLEAKSISKPIISAHEIASDDIELVLVKLPLNFDYTRLNGKKITYKKMPPKREGEVPKLAEMSFVKKEMINDKERLEIHEEGELPVINMVTLFPDAKKGKYVVGKPLRSLFQITEVFDEEYIRKQEEANKAALDAKMAEMRAKANAPDPERLKHVPSWRFSPMMLPPRAKPQLRVRWGPAGSDIDAELRASAPEVPSAVIKKYQQQVAKAAAGVSVTKTPSKSSKKEEAGSDDERKKTPSSSKKRKRSRSPTPATSTEADKKKSKSESAKKKSVEDGEKSAKKKSKKDE